MEFHEDELNKSINFKNVISNLDLAREKISKIHAENGKSSDGNIEAKLRRLQSFIWQISLRVSNLGDDIQFTKNTLNNTESENINTATGIGIGSATYSGIKTSYNVQSTPTAEASIDTSAPEQTTLDDQQEQAKPEEVNDIDKENKVDDLPNETPVTYGPIVVGIDENYDKSFFTKIILPNEFVPTQTHIEPMHYVAELKNEFSGETVDGTQVTISEGTKIVIVRKESETEGKSKCVIENGENIGKVIEIDSDNLNIVQHITEPTLEYTDETLENYINALDEKKLIDSNKTEYVWVNSYTQKMYNFKKIDGKWKVAPFKVKGYEEQTSINLDTKAFDKQIEVILPADINENTVPKESFNDTDTATKIADIYDQSSLSDETKEEFKKLTENVSFIVT